MHVCMYKNYCIANYPVISFPACMHACIRTYQSIYMYIINYTMYGHAPVSLWRGSTVNHSLCMHAYIHVRTYTCIPVSLWRGSTVNHSLCMQYVHVRTYMYTCTPVSRRRRTSSVPSPPSWATRSTWTAREP